MIPGLVSVGPALCEEVRLVVGRGVGRLEVEVSSSLPPKPKKPFESSSSIVDVGLGAEVLERDVVVEEEEEEEEDSSPPQSKSPARPPPDSVGSALLDLRVVVGSLGAGGSSGSSTAGSGLGEGGEDASIVGSCRR